MPSGNPNYCFEPLPRRPDEDEFHPQVVYYLASSATGEELEDTAFMSDVTTCVDAQPLEEAFSKVSASPVASIPVQQVAPAITASATPVSTVAPVAEVSKAEDVVSKEISAEKAE